MWKDCWEDSRNDEKILELIAEKILEMIAEKILEMIHEKILEWLEDSRRVAKESQENMSFPILLHTVKSVAIHCVVATSI